MKARLDPAKMIMLILILSLLIPLSRSIASEGQITSLSVEQEPVNETAVDVIASIGVRMKFDSPGSYIVLIRDDSTGNYVAHSFTYSVGAIKVERMVTLRFTRSADPGDYSYTAILRMRDSSTDWFDADSEHFSIYVPPPVTITNVTTTNLTQNVTEANHISTTSSQANQSTTNQSITAANQTVTETVTTTETVTLTLFNVTTLTLLKTVTKNSTATVTLAKNVTVTKYSTVTPSLPVVNEVDPKLIGLGVIGGILALLLVLGLRKR